MAQSEFSARLRALGESREQGVITDEEFARLKQQLLQAQLTPPLRQDISSFRNPQILGFALISAAVAIIFVVSFSSQNFIELVAVTQTVNLLALAAAIACAVAGGRIFLKGCVTDEVFLAVPLILAALVFPFYSFMSEVGVSTMHDIGCLIQTVATLAVVVLLVMNWDQFGWTPNMKLTSDLIVGSVGSVFLIIFVFIDAWTYQYGRYSGSIGAFWSDESIWTMLFALSLIVVFVIPTLVVTSVDPRKIAFASAGSTVAAICLWLYYFKGAIDGDYKTTGLVSIFFIGVIATAGLGVMQVVNLKNNERAVD